MKAFRQARLCRVRTCSPSLLTTARPSFQNLRAAAPSELRIVSNVRIQNAFRLYSSEASAARPVEQDVTAPPPGPVTRFADLAQLGVHPALVEAITGGMGYENMTDVQSATLNPGLTGKDIVAQAKTGTGKTLAFLVPIIQKMLADNPRLADGFSRDRPTAGDIKAIIISPTRELAEQIGEEARKLVRRTGIRVQTAVGGTQKGRMLHKTREQGCHLLVATPGRLNDLLGDQYSGIDAPSLQALVLDEADRMLDVGFADELKQILRLLPDRSQVPRQTLLFSATMPANVIHLARSFVDARNLQFVQTIKEDEEPTHEKVPQYIVPVKGYENYFPTLVELFETEMEKARNDPDAMPFKAMVFLNMTTMVQLAANNFEHLARRHHNLPPVFSIHSKFTQRERTNASESFRKAKSAILFSSDVTARGMDFPNVTHVIQVGVPPARDQYIHRLGRTGRANKGGAGWLIVSEREVVAARSTLSDLPIKRFTDLESAQFDLGGNHESLPGPFQQVADVTQRTPQGLLRDVYMSHFGGATGGRNVQDIVDQLNDWALLGWGMEEPPAMSRNIAQKRGLHRVRGLRISDENDYEENRGGRDARRDGRRGDGDFRGRRGGDRGGDIFDQMAGSQRSQSSRRPARASF